MAHNDTGFLSVAASQFGTAVGQVYAVPRYAVPADPSRESQTSNPFYASRHDVAGEKRPLDLTEFVESGVPLLNHESEASLDEPIRERRIVIMKKRG